MGDNPNLTGCGDNTLQEAISNGALPLLDPHFSTKAKTLSNLGLISEKHPQADQWAFCSIFLKMYNHYDEPFIPISSLIMTKGFMPELIIQWKKLCAYVIKYHNAFDSLIDEVAKALKAPVSPSLASLSLSNSLGSFFLNQPKTKEELNGKRSDRRNSF